MTKLKELISIAEAKNYLGDKEYTTWKSWKAAVKKANPAAWIEGDEDIAQAMVGPKPYKQGETKSIGEWGGDVGSIFAVEIKEALEKETKEMPNGVRPKGIGWTLKKAGEQSGKDFSIWERTFKKVAVKEETITEAQIPSWFKKGTKVKLTPEYADKDPDEVFTLVSADDEDGRGRIEDKNGKGWNIKHYQVLKASRSTAISESEELKKLGKELVAFNQWSNEKQHEDPEITKANEPKAPAEALTFKVGDVVIPNKGPHKGEKHLVTRVRDDGRIDIKPQGIEGESVKYRNGAAIAKVADLVIAEGYADNFKGAKLFKAGSLMAQVSVNLVESSEDDLDEKQEKWKSDVLAAHPDVASKIKFKSRIEQGKDTTSAEIGDRSYGVFDNDTGKAVVFKINESEFKIDQTKNALDNLEAFAGTKLKSGQRNVVKGFPFDIDSDSDVDNIYVEAVDLAACTGLMKALRAAGFRVKRDGDTKLEIEVYHLAD